MICNTIGIEFESNFLHNVGRRFAGNKKRGYVRLSGTFQGDHENNDGMNEGMMKVLMGIITGNIVVGYIEEAESARKFSQELILREGSLASICR